MMVLALISLFSLQAAVDPPNYDFSLDQLKMLEPGSLWDQAKISENFKTKSKLYKKIGDSSLYRIEVKQLRYRFPVFIHVDEINKKILGFYATLPRYFLHDLFHRSLIKRYGKQNKWYKVEENSVYLWQKGEIHRIYSGACTLTCFTIYYGAYLKQPKGIKGYIPITKLI